MRTAMATFRDGRVELSGPVDWPDGTTVQVTPLAAPEIGHHASGPTANESYRDFVRRLAVSLADEPFERPPQGTFENRETW